MKLRSRVLDIKPVYGSKNVQIIFEAQILPDSEINDLVGKETVLSVEEWSAVKTDQQRRYVWEMLTQLARAKKRSAYEEYEEHLRETPAFYKTKKGSYETVYLKKGREPVVEKNKHWLWLQDVEVMETTENPRRTVLSVFTRIRGMSSFTKKEMQDFIENVVYDCKQNGIETLSPDEIKSMEGIWNEKHITKG